MQFLLFNKTFSYYIYTHTHTCTFSRSWYLVILCTGFSKYESSPSLCSSFF